jgi:mono/diheme cytochrome c family protein/plastocyanin
VTKTIDMTENHPTETYPTFRSDRERIALSLVLLVVLGLPLGALGFQKAQTAGPARVVELTARLPTAEHGGWTPERITVQRGERVRLRISSADVVHGFSIPKLDVHVDWIEPGKVAEIEFTADRPGRYAFQCTVWCQLGHWRMRGVIEVIDPDDPVVSARDVDPPQTDWVASGIDIDAGHTGRFVLEHPADAANGQRLWAELSPRPLAELLSGLELRLLSPSDLYAYLSQDVEEVMAQEQAAHSGHSAGAMAAMEEAPLADLPEAAALAALSTGERWDIVAALYFAATSPRLLAASEQLYQRDCTGCHGLNGGGDGPGAAEIAALNAGQPTDHAMAMDKPPTDFTDLAAQAGAPDMRYYGKLVRGGMGTSMPYFGTLYSEEELWAIIAYLRSFAFEYPAE